MMLLQQQKFSLKMELVFFKAEGNNFTLNYKDGKPLYKLEGDNWEFYNEEGEKTISNFEIITDIKKID